MAVAIQDNDGSADYYGAVLYADHEHWAQALWLASHQLGPKPCAITAWPAHAAYMADLHKTAKRILRRLN